MKYLVTVFIGLSWGGAWADEKPTEQKTSTIEESPILDEAVYQQGKDTLTIQRIEQPEFLEKTQVEGESLNLEDELEAEKEVPLPVSTFIISATAYGKGTQIKIWPSHIGQQGALEAWSNVNWAYFQSVLAVENEEKRYNFMLFHSGGGAVEVEQGGGGVQVPAELPEFEKGGARYLVTTAKETEREETLDFLESLHELYDENHQELRINREEALEEHEERKRQIIKEAEKPQTRVLRIWRHESEETNANDQ